MKRVENLIKNKDLINTFKKSKTKNYLNKSILRKKIYFFLKFKSINLRRFIKILNKNDGVQHVFFKPLYLNIFGGDINQPKNNFCFKTILMFIKLYLY